MLGKQRDPNILLVIIIMLSEYEQLSVKHKMPDDFIGPLSLSLGYVTYSRNSSDDIEVNLIGNSFKGLGTLITATKRSNENEK